MRDDGGCRSAAPTGKLACCIFTHFVKPGFQTRGLGEGVSVHDGSLATLMPATFHLIGDACGDL